MLTRIPAPAPSIATSWPDGRGSAGRPPRGTPGSASIAATSASGRVVGQDVVETGRHGARSWPGVPHAAATTRSNVGAWLSTLEDNKAELLAKAGGRSRRRAKGPGGPAGGRRGGPADGLLPPRRARGRGRPRRGRRVRRARLASTSSPQTRPQGTARVRVFTPTVAEHGWSAGGHTVVEVVTDDMPFLVDSVTMALTTASRARPHRPRGHPPAVRRGPRRHRRAARGASPTSRRGSATTREHRRGRRRGSRPSGVLDAHRDRPGERRGRAGRDRDPARSGCSVTSATRSRTGRGCRPGSSTSSPSSRRDPPTLPDAEEVGAGRWRSCAGWPTTTSPSSATASTPWRSSGDELALRADPAPGSASCAATSSSRRPSRSCPEAVREGPRAARCWCSPRPTRSPPCTGRPTSTTSG